jgi:hypothetical protein
MRYKKRDHIAPAKTQKAGNQTGCLLYPLMRAAL